MATSYDTGAVILYVLCTNMVIQTDGTGTYISFDIETPDIEAIGPYITSASVHSFTVNRSANHDWKVTSSSSYDGKGWATAVDLSAAIVANGGLVHADYTTTTNFGLHMKFAVACRNSAGAAIERATVSVTLALRLRT